MVLIITTMMTRIKIMIMMMITMLIKMVMKNNYESIDYSLMHDGDEHRILLCDIDKKFVLINELKMIIC